MDIEKFTARMTGELVPVRTPREDHAFVPDPLPPRWKIPERLWPTLAGAKQLLGKLDGIGLTIPNPELLLRPLQQREALRSSSLEGTYATPVDLLLFELSPREPQSRDDRVNAWLEVSNYGRALREGFSSLKEGAPLSLYFIRQLHAWLLRGVRGEEARPGEFRQGQVHIGSDRRFVPAPIERLTECLTAFEQQLANRDDALDPLVACYVLHYQFEAIHPFRDGNGRVGRLLLALMTWLWCDLSRPWLYMSPFFERYKDEYIDLLFNVSARGEWTRWVEFCIRGTVEQAQDAIRRCESLGELKKTMHAAATQGSARLHELVERLFESPVVTVPLVQQHFGVSYPTAKSDIDRLVGAGVLARLGNRTHPMVFYAPQIFEIAYGDPPLSQGR